MPETLFIADLHLSPPAVAAHCADFFRQRAPQAEALYILGDLFETWVGDDDDEPVYQAIQATLRTLTDQMPVFFIAGNRDFLVGERFAAATGCQVLVDPTRIDLYGTPTLLMHGDTLCTEDIAYQTLRAQLRNPHWQQQFLAQPLTQRRAAARALRERSISDSAGKAEMIMDVTPQAVENVMRQHGVTRLIHGHTHRPAIHDFQLDGQPVQRMVLGDWSAQGSVLVCTPAACIFSHATSSASAKPLASIAGT